MNYAAECQQCGIIETGDLEDVGDAVEDHDQFHDVNITRVATDGGVDGADKWCDWCQTEFRNGPTWKVEGTRVTGYFCSRGCAERWGDNETTVERIDQPDVATDGGSKYTVPTGDGYLGTWAVRNYSTEVNAVTAGLDRGDDVTLIALDDTRVLLTRNADTDADRLAERTVNTDGYLSIGRTVLDHLNVATGGDVRLYDVDDHDGYVLVDADADPRVPTDGGQRSSAAGGTAAHPGVDTAVAQSVLGVLDEDNRLYYSAGNSTTGTDRTFHSGEDCQRLDRAKSTTSCGAGSRPRGHLCSKCFPEDLTVDDLDDALDAGGRDE